MKTLNQCLFLCALALLGGCASPDSVFSPPAASTAAPPAPATSIPSVQLLSPRAQERVPQLGARVRFRLGSEPAPSVRPVVLVRDGTGLDESNWWAMPAPTRGRQEWDAPVQFGEARDSGRHFSVIVLLLKAEDCPPPGLVGALPSGALAESERVEVIRE